MKLVQKPAQRLLKKLTLLPALALVLTAAAPHNAKAPSVMAPVTLNAPARVIALNDIKFNLSGITFNADSDTYFLIQNNTGFIYEYDRNFSTVVRKINMRHLSDDDTEDIIFLGNEQFAIVTESNQVIVFKLGSEVTSVDLGEGAPGVQVFQLPAPRKNNKGLEGICYAPSKAGANGVFYATQEDNPKRVYSFPWANGELKVTEPLPVDKIMKHRLGDLSGCLYNPATGRLLFLSHESSRIMDVARNGAVSALLDIPAHAEQYEGLTFGPQQELVLVSEPNLVVIFERAK
ncbi:MAG: SdiA-regulated domain-containing protein [Bdellovibrionaceae bacterium]|nr:SdiA-regulated domain-containing protein [Pseudobdellovibrionaceae bacterium]